MCQEAATEEELEAITMVTAESLDKEIPMVMSID
jgi:hypothetical protein